MKLLFLILPLALAETPTAEDAEQAKEAEEAYQEVSSDVNVMLIFLQDHKLSYKGYAPPDWEQPPMEVYEAALGSRPSLLPYEYFMRAVADELISSEKGLQYALWVTEQARLAAEAAATEH